MHAAGSPDASFSLSNTHAKTEDASLAPGETYCIMYCSGDEYSLSEQGGVLMHYLRLFTHAHAADATARP